MGLSTGVPQQDFLGSVYANPPSIGAIEANPVNSLHKPSVILENIRVFPNPTSSDLYCSYTLHKQGYVSIELLNAEGKQLGTIFKGKQKSDYHQMAIQLNETPGLYWLRITVDHGASVHLPVVKTAQ
jgi:hypothetical protein